MMMMVNIMMMMILIMIMMMIVMMMIMMMMMMILKGMLFLIYIILDGYTGEGCEVEVDECIPDPCLNNGRCVDQLNGYICICSPGFQGTECQEKIEYCQTQVNL